MNDQEARSSLFLSRVDARNWRILDRKHPSTDTRHVVAWIRETGDDGVRVAWSRAAPLPTIHRTAAEALAEACRWTQPPPGTQPIDIPHFPPATT